MDTATWQRAKAIFQQVLDLPQECRSERVQMECASNPELSPLILRWLKRHDQPAWSLDGTLFDPSVWSGEANEPAPLFTGETLDAFEIDTVIGSGGMGVVYRGRQLYPARPVAIKLLAPCRASSEEDTRRFELEAATLARMHHPGIAQIYAAGQSDLGRGLQHWFAMELIEGPTLDQFLKQAELTSRQKLALFQRIVDAVQHAHGRGVIHRDLKPTNILIARTGSDDATQPESRDGEYPFQPKIVDFGLARQMDVEPLQTLQTMAGDVLGTLNYMSPEQARESDEAIGPASDVFSLGVIGFEMLSGRLPFQRAAPSLVDSLNNVRNQLPERLRRVAPQLDTDLDIILGKALETDPVRRYHNAGALADDIRRYLEGKPIEARPPSMIYRSRRFVRRHRVLVAVTLGIVGLLVTSLVLIANQARRAQRSLDLAQYEIEKSRAVNDFMTNDFLIRVLAANRDPATERSSIVHLVEHASDRIPEMFGDQPRLEAAIRNEIGTVYYNLRAFDEAADQFQRALDLWEDELGPDHADTLKAVNNLGQSLSSLGRWDEAERFYRRAYAGRLNLNGESDPTTLASMLNLATLYHKTQRLDQAESLFRRSVTLHRQHLGPNHKNTLIAQSNLANLLMDLGEMDEAIQLDRETYAAAIQTLGEDHQLALWMGERWIDALCRSKNYSAALQALDELLPRLIQVQGETGPGPTRLIRTKARVLRDRDAPGDRATARNLLTEALQRFGDPLPDNQQTRLLQNDLERLSKADQ